MVNVGKGDLEMLVLKPRTCEKSRAEGPLRTVSSFCDTATQEGGEHVLVRKILIIPLVWFVT